MAYLSVSSLHQTSATPSVTVPASAAANIIAVMGIAIDSATATLTQGVWPSGFTLFEAPITITADNQRVAVGWKRLTGADSGSYTFGSLGVTAESTIVAAYFSGRSTTSDPVLASASNNTQNAAPTVTATAPSLTAASGDDLCVFAAFDVTDTGIVTGVAPPSGYTERADVPTGWSPVELATLDAASAGATGTQAAAATLSAGFAGWAAYHIQIPVAGGAAAVLSPLQITGPSYAAHRAASI